jgi:hypothetical protein
MQLKQGDFTKLVGRVTLHGRWRFICDLDRELQSELVSATFKYSSTFGRQCYCYELERNCAERAVAST